MPEWARPQRRQRRGFTGTTLLTPAMGRLASLPLVPGLSSGASPGGGLPRQPRDLGRIARGGTGGVLGVPAQSGLQGRNPFLEDGVLPDPPHDLAPQLPLLPDDIEGLLEHAGPEGRLHEVECHAAPPSPSAPPRQEGRCQGERTAPERNPPNRLPARAITPPPPERLREGERLGRGAEPPYTAGRISVRGWGRPM